MSQKEIPLKRIRLSLGKSRAALAREANIDAKTLAAIEAGKRPGNDVTREKIKQTMNRLRGVSDPLGDEDLFGTERES